MRKYRKKPVVIEAQRLLGLSSAELIQSWALLNEVTIKVERTEYGIPYLLIPTLEGEMRADFGDWIIRGVKGEFYPCKPDVFESSYEEV